MHPGEASCQNREKTTEQILNKWTTKFDKKMLHLGDATFWKSCDLDLTLKGYPMLIVLR